MMIKKSRDILKSILVRSKKVVIKNIFIKIGKEYGIEQTLKNCNYNTEEHHGKKSIAVRRTA